MSDSPDAPAVQADVVLFDGAEFLMGSSGRFAYPADGEGPVRRVRLDPYGLIGALSQTPTSRASSMGAVT